MDLSNKRPNIARKNSATESVTIANISKNILAADSENPDVFKDSKESKTHDSNAISISVFESEVPFAGENQSAKALSADENNLIIEIPKQNEVFTNIHFKSPSSLELGIGTNPKESGFTTTSVKRQSKESMHKGKNVALLHATKPLKRAINKIVRKFAKGTHVPELLRQSKDEDIDEAGSEEARAWVLAFSNGEIKNVNEFTSRLGYADELYIPVDQAKDIVARIYYETHRARIKFLKALTSLYGALVFFQEKVEKFLSESVDIWRETASVTFIYALNEIMASFSELLKENPSQARFDGEALKHSFTELQWLSIRVYKELDEILQRLSMSLIDPKFYHENLISQDKDAEVNLKLALEFVQEVHRNLALINLKLAQQSGWAKSWGSDGLTIEEADKFSCTWPMGKSVFLAAQTDVLMAKHMRLRKTNLADGEADLEAQSKLFLIAQAKALKQKAAEQGAKGDEAETSPAAAQRLMELELKISQQQEEIKAKDQAIAESAERAKMLSEMSGDAEKSAFEREGGITELKEQLRRQIRLCEEQTAVADEKSKVIEELKAQYRANDAELMDLRQRFESSTKEQKQGQQETSLTVEMKENEIRSLKQQLEGQAYSMNLIEQAAEKERKRAEELEIETDRLRQLGQSDIANLKALRIALEEAGNEQAGNLDTIANLRAENQKLSDSYINLQIIFQERSEDLNLIDTYKRIAREKEEEAAALREELDEALLRLRRLEKAYKDATISRRRLLNKVMDAKGKVRVYCRVRPMAPYEIAQSHQSVITIPNETSIDINTQKGVKQYNFDCCFGPESKQEEIFDELVGLVEAAVEGDNVCVFSYGQTGTGKTFTMQGVPNFEGIVPRCINEVYSLLESRRRDALNFSVQCSILELYNEQITDLMSRFATRKSLLPVEIKKEGTGLVTISNVTLKECYSAAEMYELYTEAVERRVTASTKLNEASSRSHLIFLMYIQVDDLLNNLSTISKISLIDLAGSERVNKSGVTNARFEEARNINKSLSALADVICALSSPHQGFVPYRNNKLTLLLSDSLGGTSKSAMIVTLSPSEINLDESLSSLQYAARVRLIVNQLKKVEGLNEVQKLRTELQKVLSEVNTVRGMVQDAGNERNPQTW